MCRFPTHRAQATVNTAALQANLALLEGCTPQYSAKKPRTIAVVKANAYGHGDALVVPALWEAGCDFFAVATPDEAISVRKIAPRADILILGYTPPTLADVLAEERLHQTVFSLDYARELSECTKAKGRSVRVHLKIDGGMCRLGFAPESLAEILAAATLPGLEPVGIYTHFPCADADKSVTRAAFSRFLQCKNTLKRCGFSLFSHAAASAASLTLPETALDGVRVGLALYGIPPVATTLPLRQVLTLTAPVVQIHEVPEGTPVGYGGTFVTSRPSKIGTLPIGYADGIPRRFKECVGQVRIMAKGNTFFAPVAGNICMDQMMLDLTKTPVEIGDRAVFFAPVTEAATALGTIPYELLTGIGARVLRTATNERI